MRIFLKHVLVLTDFSVISMHMRAKIGKKNKIKKALLRNQSSTKKRVFKFLFG